MIRKGKKALMLYVLSLAMVIALFSVSGTYAFADARDLEEIRNAIKAKGAKWHADETSVSKLTMKEKKMRLGHKDDGGLAAIAGETTDLAPIATVEGLPATLDWRNVGGISYVSSIKNQGQCGSCWAFAVTAALESQVMIGTSGNQVDLAEQLLVACDSTENTGGSCSGGYPTVASNYIRDKGLPPESCFPYTATNNVCSNVCDEWKNGQATLYKVIGWHTAATSAYPTRVDEIKNALYTYGPVVGTFYVYNDFYSYRSGVYSYTTGSYIGAHAVLIVGYDDVQQAFIVKNSWGTGWGEAGYFMVAYSEVGGTSRFAYSALAYDGYGDNPPPPPPPPPTCTYTLSPASKTFKVAGGSGSITVATPSTCSWQATKIVDWVQITSGSSGTGNGTINYTVFANTGASRTATITIEGQNHTITQQAVKRTRK